jgi:hypothetical protein
MRLVRRIGYVPSKCLSVKARKNFEEKQKTKMDTKTRRGMDPTAKEPTARKVPGRSKTE